MRWDMDWVLVWYNRRSSSKVGKALCCLNSSWPTPKFPGQTGLLAFSCHLLALSALLSSLASLGHIASQRCQEPFWSVGTRIYSSQCVGLYLSPLVWVRGGGAGNRLLPISQLGPPGGKGQDLPSPLVMNYSPWDTHRDSMPSTAFALEAVSSAPTSWLKCLWAAQLPGVVISPSGQLGRVEVTLHRR